MGSHVIDLLIGEECKEIVAIDNMVRGRRENLASAMDRFPVRLIEGDIRDSSLMSGLVKETDIVFHLAAAVGVRLIVESPVRTIETNIKGTEIILDLASKKKKKVLITSTSEVYGKSAKIPFS